LKHERKLDSYQKIMEASQESSTNIRI